MAPALVSALQGQVLVEWDVVSGSVTEAAVSSSVPTVVATPVTLGPGITINSSGSRWRTVNYQQGIDGYVEFAVTAVSGNILTLESLTLSVEAQAGNGTGMWVAPELRLEYSQDPSFATVVDAGTLDLGADLDGTSGSVRGGFVTADVLTFLGTDLVVNGGETFYFRLLALGAASAGSDKNQISYDLDADIQLNGTSEVSLAGLIWAGADGDSWNSTEPNFSSNGSPSTFSTGDDVTINSAGAIVLASEGVLAGALNEVTDSGTVSLQGGDLTTTGLVKTGGSTLRVESPVNFDTGAGSTSLLGGELRLASDASYTTSSLTLAGDSTLFVEGPNGNFTNSGVTTLGPGGGTIRLNTGVSATLGTIEASGSGLNFIKQGSGELTITGAVGERNVSPVDLDLAGGILNLSGGLEVSVTGENLVSGTMNLLGSELVLHGSTVTGGGSIVSGDDASVVISRFNAGASLVEVPLILNSDLTVEAPTGNSELKLTLSGLNTYTGTTTLSDGRVEITSLGNLGEPSSLGAPLTEPGALVVEGGVELFYTGPAVETDREFVVGAGGATIVSDGTGPMVFNSPFLMLTEGTGSAERELVFAGSAPGINSFAMDIGNALNANNSVTKAGSTIWSLVGENLYSGVTLIEEGILRIDGDSSGVVSATTVEAGGFLGGNGTFGSSVSLASGGGLAVSISDWAGAAGTGYDDLDVASLDAGSAPLVVAIDTTGMVNFAEDQSSFTILNTASGITGFDPAQVSFVTTGFNGFGAWSLAQVGNSLVLSYEGSTSPYLAWAGGFGLLGTDAAQDFDFDGDGFDNALEFVLGSDPTDSSSTGSIVGTAGSSSFDFSFERLDESELEIALEVQFGSDLVGWDEIAIPSAAGVYSLSGATVTILEGVPATEPDSILVEMPYTSTPAGKLFLRLTVPAD